MSQKKLQSELRVADQLLWDKRQAAAMLAMGPGHFDECRKNPAHPLSKLTVIGGKPMRFDPREVRQAREEIIRQGFV